jgi:Grx4 family monothiol glutaredoxin
MLAFCVFLLVALLRCSSGFVVVPAAARSRALSCRHPAVDLVRAAPGSDENLRPDVAAQMDEIRGQTLARIEDLVKGNTVMLFMKGNKFFPQCGFSNTAVQILRSCDVEFETSDVLSDPDIRQYVKEYSQWPTIPQVRQARDEAHFSPCCL